MGLTALSGGGFPAFASTVSSTGDGLSTNPPHPVGTEAVDSSGGKYVMMRVGSTTQIVGSWVLLNSSIGVGVTSRLSTGASLTSSGSALGVAMSTANSTNQFAWYQVVGLAAALGGSTSGAGGAKLWQSTTVAGAVIDSSGGSGIQNAQITSSNASSLWNVWIAYPHVATLTGS